MEARFRLGATCAASFTRGPLKKSAHTPSNAREDRPRTSVPPVPLRCAVSLPGRGPLDSLLAALSHCAVPHRSPLLSPPLPRCEACRLRLRFGHSLAGVDNVITTQMPIQTIRFFKKSNLVSTAEWAMEAGRGV
jgi:hypothetical protein